MRLTVSVLWMVAVTAWALEENSGNDLYDGHFPPLHPNYTQPQSLTDLLLLRQEIQLKELKQAEQESAGILREMADLLADIKGSLTRNNTSIGISCPGNFRNFGETCLYLAKDVGINWEEALLFCQDLGGHLAVFRDVSAFAHALGYIKASGIAKTGNVWVGGNDHSVEGEWMWVTGEHMPRGTPFWGDLNYVREPAQGTAGNCALLHGPDDFLIHDAPCDWKVIPLCEISASRTC